MRAGVEGIEIICFVKWVMSGLNIKLIEVNIFLVNISKSICSFT